MNIYEAKTSKLTQKIYLDNEYYAIASNNTDKIAIGGEKQQIDIHTIVKNDNTNGFIEKFDD